MTVYIVMDKRGFVSAVYASEQIASRHATEISGRVSVRQVRVDVDADGDKNDT